MRGRDGAERFPPAVEPSLEAAVLRSLRPLDLSLSLDWVKRTITGHEESHVIRARNLTLQHRPENVKAFFEAQFRRIVPAEQPPAPVAVPIRSVPGDDPYGF
jgi:hypothetical protein